MKVGAAAFQLNKHKIIRYRSFLETLVVAKALQTNIPAMKNAAKPPVKEQHNERLDSLRLALEASGSRPEVLGIYKTAL